MKQKRGDQKGPIPLSFHGGERKQGGSQTPAPTTTTRRGREGGGGRRCVATPANDRPSPGSHRSRKTEPKIAKASEIERGRKDWRLGQALMIVEAGGDALPNRGHGGNGGTTGCPFIACEDRESDRVRLRVRV